MIDVVGKLVAATGTMGIMFSLYIVFSRQKEERTEIDCIIDEFNQEYPDTSITNTTPFCLGRLFHVFLLLFPVIGFVIVGFFPGEPVVETGLKNFKFWLSMSLLMIPTIFNLSFLIYVIVSQKIHQKKFEAEYGELLAEIEAEERKSTENSAE